MRNKLKIIILERDYTIKKLAEELDLSPQTISNWCNSKNLENIQNFYRLCEKLDVDIRDVFREE